MALTVGQTTLGTIKTIARQRADMVNSGFISDSELTAYVNLSYLELYDLLVTKYGNEYFVQLPHHITTDGINENFALPPDFYKLLGVDLWLSNSKDSRIKENFIRVYFTGALDYFLFTHFNTSPEKMIQMIYCL